MPAIARARQEGIALITALLVVALATVVAVEIAARERLDIRRTQNLIASNQAYDLAIAAEAWALDMLREDLENPNSRDVDGAQDSWAQPIVLPPLEGATLGMRIEDLQGRFNLNNLAGAVSLPGEPQQAAAASVHYRRFQLLLENLQEKHQLQINPPELIDSLIDWMDQDQLTRPLGAEDSYYMALEVPRRTANRMLTSASELQLIKGFTPEVYRALAPYVVALPATDVAINVNTAPPEVLRMLDRRISEAAALQLDAQRRNQPWKDLNEFGKSGQLPEAGFDAQSLAVTSQYFAYHGDVALGPAHVRLESLISRVNGMQVLARSRGSL